MIITKSPLRISYLGGGTDYPAYFEKDFGCSIGATIDKYVYVISNPLSSTSHEKIRFSYNQVESCNEISELEHPVAREVLGDFRDLMPINISTFSDIPARNGLGGSSAFTAALFKNLLEVRGESLVPSEIAKYAVEIERKRLNEIGGYQDQYQTSIGGFNYYRFEENGIQVDSRIVSPIFLEYLTERQILIYSGYSRTGIPERHLSQDDSVHSLDTIRDLTVDTCLGLKENLLNPQKSFQILRKGVSEYWNVKKWLMGLDESDPLFSEVNLLRKLNLDFTYKLLGAGGGWFFLILANLETISIIKNVVGKNRWIQPSFSEKGTVKIEIQ